MYGALSNSELFSARMTANGTVSLPAPTSLCALSSSRQAPGPCSSTGGCCAELSGQNHSAAWRPTKRVACAAAAVEGSGGMVKDRDRLLQAQQSAAADPGDTDRSQDVARAAQRVIAEANSSARSKASDENRQGLVSCTAAWKATDRQSRGRKSACSWQLATQRKSHHSEFRQLLLRPANLSMEGTLGWRRQESISDWPAPGNTLDRWLRPQMLLGLAAAIWAATRRRAIAAALSRFSLPDLAVALLVATAVLRCVADRFATYACGGDEEHVHQCSPTRTEDLSHTAGLFPAERAWGRLT